MAILRDIVVTANEFSWLCGLFEGEGTFTCATPAMPRKPRMSIGMTDQDVIVRVLAITGTRMVVHRWPDDRYLPVYRTEVVGGSAVALMNRMRPLMSCRRQEQIDQAVATFQPLRKVRHKTYTIITEAVEQHDRYWLAGLLEGEAWFGLNTTATQTISPMVELNSVDFDVIERVQQIWRARYAIDIHIHTRPPRRVGYQPQFHVACYGAAARRLLSDIVPLMGQRRSARINELLGAWEQPRLIGERRSRYMACDGTASGERIGSWHV